MNFDGLQAQGAKLFATVSPHAQAWGADHLLAGMLADIPPLKQVMQYGAMKWASTGGKLTRGVLVWTNLDSPTGMDFFQFPMNPSELSDSEAPDYAEIKAPGQNRPLYQFVHGGARQVEFTLNFFYDHPDRSMIKQYIEKLRSLTKRPLRRKNDATYSATGGPPPVRFYFGDYFQGERFIVSKLDVKAFDLFDAVSLYPMRAEVRVCLLEAPSDTDVLSKALSNPVGGVSQGALSAIARGML